MPEGADEMKLDWFGLLKSFGPMAFGVVVVLLIWQMIVQPNMDKQSLDFKAFNEAVSAIQRISIEQLEVSRQLKDTAQGLERAAVEFNRNMQR